MRKAVNFRATVFAAAGLTAGILLSYFSVTENLAGKVATGVTAAIVFTVFTFLSSAKFKSTGKILCFLFFALFFAIGAFSFNKLAKDYTAANLGGNILTVRGSVGEISSFDDYTEIVLTDIKVSGAVNGESRYKAGVYLYGENALRLGDEIESTAALTDKDLIYNGKFAASSLARGVKYFAEVNAGEITLLSRSPDIFQKCNLYIFDTLKKGLKIDEFATAYAILTGNSDYMTEENLTAYRVAGVAHIFAVSGLHIGFLATAIYFILNKLKLNRYAAFFITLFAAAFYSGVCGFSASSLRAVIMFFFLNFARLTGLKYDGISSVFAAALLILIISPAELFCVGFLLSFSVVITVIVLFNPLTRLLKFLPKKLAASLAVSFLAEIGGAPVLLCFFGQFPALSVFINILFVPIAGVVFTLLHACVLLSAVIPPEIALFLPEYALFGLNYFIRLLDFKAFLVGGFTLGIFSAAYYGLIAVSGGLINIKKVWKAIVCALLCVAVIGGTFIKTARDYGKVNATVIGSSALSAVYLNFRGENLLIISEVSYKNFSRYRIKKALQGDAEAGVTVVLLSQDDKTELTALTLRFLTVTDIKALYYCGEENTTAEKVMAKTFPDIKVKAVNGGDKIPMLGGNLGFALNGKCCYLDLNGYIFAAFNSLAGSTAYTELDILPNAVVLADSFDGVNRALSPETIVSYRREYGYPDGETHGNYAFTLG